MEMHEDLHRYTISNIQEVLDSIDFKSSRRILLRGHNVGLCISGEIPMDEYCFRYNRLVVLEIVVDKQHMEFG